MTDKGTIIGVIFGLLKSLLLFVFLNYLVSTYIDDYHQSLLVPSIAFAGLSTICFSIFVFFTHTTLSKLYWISQLVYSICIILIFINYLTINITVFQPREMYFADGFVIPFFELFAIVLSEISQIGVVLLKKLIGS